MLAHRWQLLFWPEWLEAAEAFRPSLAQTYGLLGLAFLASASGRLSQLWQQYQTLGGS